MQRLTKVEAARISEELRMRRMGTPSLWMLPLEEAIIIEEMWVAFWKKRQAQLKADPSLIQPYATAYGEEKARRARVYGQERETRILNASIYLQARVEFGRMSYQVPGPGGRSIEKPIVPPRDQMMLAYRDIRSDSHLKYKNLYSVLLSECQISLEQPMSKGGQTEPRLVISSKDGASRYVVFGVAKDHPTLLWPAGCRDFNLFTATSKMSSPSFSLPAGAVAMGGTCSSSEIKGDASREGSNICAMCYALKGHYGYLSNILPSLIRRAWVNQVLALDPTGDRLAADLKSSIRSFAEFATLGGWDNRRGQELGLWDGSSIVGPRSGRGKQPKRLEPLLPTDLSPETIEVVSKSDVSAHQALKIPKNLRRRVSRRGKTTFELLARSNPKPGDVAGYFRIHDSGDFTVQRPTAYIRAWRTVAQDLRYVRFWAPTRLWIQRGMWAPLSSLAELLNFSVRPSAIHVGDPAPDIAGMSAGTTVNEYVKKAEAYTPAFGVDGAPAFQCPVYSRTIFDAKTEKMREAKSCHEAGCRVCWEAKMTPVAYGKH